MIETEIKIEIDRENKFREIYVALGSPDWSIQRNYIFEFGGNILRLRYEDLSGNAFMTAKGKDAGVRFNERPEFECPIPGDFFINFARLRKTSNPPSYYEKSRASAKFMGCTVCLDNFFGTYYLEVEGSEKDIPNVIKRFGLEEFPIEKRSYAQMLGEM